MMKKKIIFILFILLVFAIPTVSAEDTADINNLTISEESIVVEDSPSLNYLDVGESEVSTQNEVFVSGSFTDLNDIISSSSSGDTISLSGDIIRQGSELTNGISISHDLTINGNGYTIDANHNGRIFNINADIILTLNNITLANANTASYGGVIFSSFNDITVEGNNVNFINNSADDGGAIAASMGNVAVSGDNINFINNRAVDTGGAIDSTYGSVGISGNNINFINNTADDGGAIYTIWEDVTISGDNISFISNTGSSSIYSSGITATNTIFLNNSPIEASSGNLNGNYWGSENPASLVSGGVSVDNWIVPVIGGSDVVIGEEYEYTISLVNSTDNSVVDASRLASIKVQISKPDGSSEELVLDDNTNDYTTDISSIGTVSVIDSVTGNELSSLDINTIIPGNTFTALNKTINGNTGDIINLEYDYYFDADYDSAFVEGIIINRNLTVNGNGYTLDANHSGRIFNVADSVTLTLNDITLANGYATEEGGAIYANYGMIIVGDNVNFINNSVSDWPWAEGGAIYSYNVSISGVNVSFVDNYAHIRGGAIVTHSSDGYLSISGVNVSFVNNTVSYGNGGAIFSYANMNIDGVNVSFVDNYASDHAGAIAVPYNLSISGVNVSFVNNSAGSSGGAIQASDMNIGGVNVSFVNNSAGSRGGAIDFMGDMESVGIISGVNVSFVNNSANGTGGAIQLDIMHLDKNTAFIIEGSNVSFEGNNATSGGAISIDIDGLVEAFNNTIVINGSSIKFVNNSASEYGGAIYLNNRFYGYGSTPFNSSQKGFIINGVDVSFINNSAGNGGVISINKDDDFNGNGGLTYINNTLFESNVAVNGSTIFNECNLTIEESDFVSNVASNNGTIWNAGNLNVYSSYFENNNASYGGVINNIGNLTVNNSKFSNNKGYSIYNTLGYYDLEYYEDVNLTGYADILNSEFNGDSVVYNKGYIYSSNNTVVSDDNYFIFNDEEGIVISPVLTIAADEYYVPINETINIYIALTDDNGNNIYDVDCISATVKDVESDLTFNIDSGFYEFDFTSDIAEPVPILANYGGYLKHDAVVFTKIDTGMTVSGDVNYDYGEDFKFVIAMDPAITDEVNVTVRDENGHEETFACPIVGGNINYDSIDMEFVPGEYTITVDYAGSDEYEASTATFTVTVNQLTADLNITAADTVYGDDVNITVVVDNNASGTVDVDIDGETYEVNLVNGSGSILVSGLDAGDYEIIATYDGDMIYAPAFINSSVSVAKGQANITAEIGDVSYGNAANVIVSCDASGYVDIYVDNEYFASFFVDGEVNFPIYNLEVGSHELRVLFQNDNYIVSEAIVSFNVTGENVYADDLTKYYLNESAFTATVTRGSNQAVSGVEVVFEINGIEYTKITNNEGVASLNINLVPGEYSVIVSYGNQTLVKSVTVLPTIIIENLTKYYHNESQYIIILLDGQGNPIANKNVTVNINGVFYSRETNSSGIAVLNINLNPGEYIATVQDPLTGLMMSSTVVVISTVNVDNLVKYYGNSSSLEIAVVNSHGNPLAGQDVSININGVFYNRTTNAEGIAILNINLNPGEYIATVQDLRTGLLMSCNIIVIPVLTASDVVMDYNDGSQYEVKVLDEHGNPVANETVTMNINGVFYNRTSDSDGIARLNINLNPGEYIITAYHETAYVSNRIIVN